MPSVLPAVAGVLMRTPQAVKPVPFWYDTWKFGELSRSMLYSVKLLAWLVWIIRKLFCVWPLDLACAARSHHVVDVPRMSRSPRASMRPCAPLDARTPSMPEFEPFTVMNGWQPPELDDTVPHVADAPDT